MRSYRAENSRKGRVLRALLSRGRPWLAAAGLAGVVGVGRFAAGPEASQAPVEEVSEENSLLSSAQYIEAAVTPSDANELGVSTRWDLPNLDHPRVDYWVGRYSTDRDMRKKFEGFLRRSGWYREMIARQLAERGMPQDLLFLSMIESGFQPRAYSPAAASGLWQFVSETGRRYGLAVDASVDERKHPERATAAALDYLQDLHDRSTRGTSPPPRTTPARTASGAS